MNSETQYRLELVLDREIEAAKSLAATLEAERAALTGSSPEAVTREAAHKTEIFGVITALETQRRELCDAVHISLPPIRQGRTLLIAGVSQDIADRWRALLELIAGCRVANEVNGYIINARRGQIHQLLQVLRGGTPNTYGPQGRLFNHSQRALARA
jgi:flagellar biosynthesis/type III secretory pathway chaperone